MSGPHAYVLEAATGEGDALIVVATSVEALRAGWDGDIDADYYVLQAVAHTLRAIDDAAPPLAAFRVWHAGDHSPSSHTPVAVFDLRRCVRLSEGETTATLDDVSAFAALGGVSRATRVDVDWAAIAAALPPLGAPLLGRGEDLFVGVPALPARLALGVTNVD